DQPLAERLGALGEAEGRERGVRPLDLSALVVPAVGVGRGRPREEREVADGLLEDRVGGVLVRAVRRQTSEADQARRRAIDVANRLFSGGANRLRTGR